MVLRIGPLIVSNEFFNTITCYYSTLRMTVSRNKASQDGRHCSMLYFKYWKVFPMHAGVMMSPPSCYSGQFITHFLQQNCHFDAFKCFFLDILRNIQEDCELSFWCLEKTSIISCSFILFYIFMLIWYEYEGCLPQLLIVTTNNMWLNPSNIIHLNWIWMQQISNITV